MLGHLKISQHNTARSREVLQTFFEVALKEEALFLCIQEPYLYKHSITHSFTPLSVGNSDSQI